MLNSYRKFPDHNIYMLNELNQQIIKRWVDAKANGQFSEELFSDSFKEIILAEKRKPTAFYTLANDIYDKVKGKKELQLKIESAAAINNNIQSLCESDELTPITYAAFEEDGIAADLKNFYGNFYTIGFTRATFKRLFETDLKDYYFNLKEEKKLTVCPFCAITPFLTKVEKMREAFDHYFPKSVYPFNSVNPDNLFPMCHNCNSKYKGAREVIFKHKERTKESRRKAVFPFDEVYKFSKLDIKMVLTKEEVNFRKLTEDDFDIKITYQGKQEEIDGWMDIFGIKNRFKGQILDNFISWYSNFANEKGKTINLEEIEVLRLLNPLTEKRFLQYSAIACFHKLMSV